MIFLATPQACSKPAPVVQAAGIDLTGYATTSVPGSEFTHVIAKDNQGYTLAEGLIRNGQREGAWVDYHPGSHVAKNITSYVNGVANGPSIELDKRGQMVAKTGYINNDYHGVKAYLQLWQATRRGAIQSGQARWYSQELLRWEIPRETPTRNRIQKRSARR